ncbi:MAG: peptide chain release factor 1 [Candidatus Eremiobacteraeota bacterium]|nr:peptide chain release factor 1 [Candidatus Eremiobacteraeota bacterium]
MLEKLKIIEDRHKKITEQLCQPEVLRDPNKLRDLSRGRSELDNIVNLAAKYREVLGNLEEAGTMLEVEEDPEMLEFLKDEKTSLEKELKDLEKKILLELIPKDPHAHKDIIMEIRQGAGGEEAALFGADLLRMYLKYAEKKGFKTEILDIHEKELGGIKEVVFSVKGKGAYRALKFESGVHRVQRVPNTEASGRIHTSTVTVAVLLEVEEVEVDINPTDLRVDTYRSSGAGGQHVNKTDSAVRLTHEPTGIVVACQDERSQRQNREKAMRILRAKIYEVALKEQERKIASSRKTQVGTGDRSEKIRTYNFPQSRVTDHRISLSLHNLEYALEGDLDVIIAALQKNEREEQLKAAVE